jgi:hypothetical protein
MIEDNYAICPVCGKHYTYTNARTDRCPVCCPKPEPEVDDYDYDQSVNDDDLAPESDL